MNAELCKGDDEMKKHVFFGIILLSIHVYVSGQTLWQDIKSSQDFEQNKKSYFSPHEYRV